MKIYDNTQSKGVKLCNVSGGTVVQVRNEDGTIGGPHIVVASVPIATLNRTGQPPPPAPPPPTTPPSSSFNQTNLLDPVSGRVYAVHSSTRCIVHDTAALVLNYITE